MNYRLIALDLDGTLLNSAKRISARTRAALVQARARGIVTVIATGRTVHSARYYGRMIGTDPVICCNGAVVLDGAGKSMWTRPVPAAPLSRALLLCRDAGLPVECHTEHGLLLDRPFAQVAGYLSWVQPHMASPGQFGPILRAWWLNHIRPVRDLAGKAQRGQLPPIFKLMLTGAQPDLDAIARQINRELPGLEVTTSGPFNLELTAAGVSKGSALQALAARLQIPRGAIAAIGDSDNDVEMLEYAGLGIAMGSGSSAAKAAADQVAPPCDEDGAAQAIEALLGDPAP